MILGSWMSLASTQRPESCLAGENGSKSLSLWKRGNDKKNLVDALFLQLNAVGFHPRRRNEGPNDGGTSDVSHLHT